MSNYYFVNAALPPLSLGTPPEITFQELRTILRENLSADDLKQVAYLLRPIDLANIRALWMGMPLDERGNFSPKELEEALLVPDGLPQYLSDFLDQYESIHDRLRFFPALYAALYRETSGRSGFLVKAFAFERDVRLVLTALRAKKTGRDVARELQFEDPTDTLVADILAQKDSPDYTPPAEYEGLKALFEKHSENPKELFQALLEYRFSKYEELEENEHFTLDRILSYLARLLIVESWEELRSEKGRDLMEDLSKYG